MIPCIIYFIIKHNAYAPSHSKKKCADGQTPSPYIRIIMQCSDGQNYTRDSCCSGDKT